MKKHIGVIEIGSSSVKSLHPHPSVTIATSIEDFSVKVERIKKPKTDTLGMEIFRQLYLPQIMKSLFFMQSKKIHRLYIVMTGVWRDIENIQDLILVLENETNQKVTLLSAEKEGLLSTLSFVSTKRDTVVINSDIQNINIDLGGTSTEISVYTHPSQCQTVSLPLGTNIILDEILAAPEESLDTIIKRLIGHNLDILDQYFSLTLGEILQQATLSATGGVIKKAAQEIIDPLGTMKNRSRNFIHNYPLTQVSLEQQRTLYRKIIMTPEAEQEIRAGGDHDSTRDALFGYIHLKTYLKIMERFKIETLIINASGISYGYFFHAL